MARKRGKGAPDKTDKRVGSRVRMRCKMLSMSQSKLAGAWFIGLTYYDPSGCSNLVCYDHGSLSRWTPPVAEVRPGLAHTSQCHQVGPIVMHDSTSGLFSRVVAKRIIELASEGDRDPDRLRHGALALSMRDRRRHA